MKHRGMWLRAYLGSDKRLVVVNYPVIADASHRLRRIYEVLLEEGRVLGSTFIIDPDGYLRHMQVNDLYVGRNVEETLRTGELCPVSWR